MMKRKRNMRNTLTSILLVASMILGVQTGSMNVYAAYDDISGSDGSVLVTQSEERNAVAEESAKEEAVAIVEETVTEETVAAEEESDAIVEQTATEETVAAEEESDAIVEQTATEETDYAEEEADAAVEQTATEETVAAEAELPISEEDAAEAEICPTEDAAEAEINLTEADPAETETGASADSIVNKGIYLMYVQFSHRNVYAVSRGNSAGGNIATTGLGTSNALRFQISKVTGKYYRIDNFKTGLPIVVNGTNVELGEWTGGAEQLWSFTKKSDGWIIKNKKTGKVLDVQDGKSTYSTNIDVASANGANYQTWCLEEAQISVEGFSVSGLMSRMPWTGKAIEQDPKIFLRDLTLVKDVDYTLSYQNNVETGTASCIISGIGKYTGTQTRTFTIFMPIDISKATIGGISRSYGFAMKYYTPSFRVIVNGVTLTPWIDYNYEFSDNYYPGTAKLTITGIGNYGGTRIKKFKIVDCVSSLVSGQTYHFVPKNNASTAVCSYTGKMVNNTKVYITNRSSSEAMKFKAIQNSDGTWKFINEKCELALAVKQNSSKLGAGLVLYEQTNKKAQNWRLVRKSDNSFAIINAVTGYSIAMSNSSAVKGTTLSMAKTASSGLQRFYIAETDPVDKVFAGTYTLHSVMNENYVLDVAGGSGADGANIDLYMQNNTNAQKFKAVYSGGNFYRLVNVSSNRVLTVKGNTKTNGANVIQSRWVGQSGQRWKFVPNDDGSMVLKSALGTVLKLNSSSARNGANIVSATNASMSQKGWFLAMAW